MPRIPVRTTPYHTLPRCTRHYKSKRDLILRALGKASFINGSQFVIAWISPKGEVDVYASELLQSSVTAKEGGVLDRKELDKEAGRVKEEMGRRWEEIRRLEEKGEAPVLEEDDDEDADGDRTLVDDEQPLDDKPVLHNFATMTTTTSTRSSTPAPPMHTLTLAPEAIEAYYTSRFAALQQATCKLVVKAWIKVIEPKKQMKFPYNKGEDLKPQWWPEGVRHREPDHLSKTGESKVLIVADSRTIDPVVKHHSKSTHHCRSTRTVDCRSCRVYLSTSSEYSARGIPRCQGGREECWSSRRTRRPSTQRSGLAIRRLARATRKANSQRRQGESCPTETSQGATHSSTGAVDDHPGELLSTSYDLYRLERSFSNDRCAGATVTIPFRNGLFRLWTITQSRDHAPPSRTSPPLGTSCATAESLAIACRFSSLSSDGHAGSAGDSGAGVLCSTDELYATAANGLSASAWAV